MFSNFEKVFILSLFVMFSITPLVLHHNGEDVRSLMPWAGFGIAACFGGFILDRIFRKERTREEQ